mmetsp:Transcript_1505/g.3265  ORF Transcript_1505/g.3265 Transcript_1505/m.3265 type:complete len:101 (-) Transcript_1505:33-335(-)
MDHKLQKTNPPAAAGESPAAAAAASAAAASAGTDNPDGMTSEEEFEATVNQWIGAVPQTGVPDAPCSSPPPALLTHPPVLHPLPLPHWPAGNKYVVCCRL